MREGGGGCKILCSSQKLDLIFFLLCIVLPKKIKKFWRKSKEKVKRRGGEVERRIEQNTERIAPGAWPFIDANYRGVGGAGPQRGQTLFFSPLLFSFSFSAAFIAIFLLLLHHCSLWVFFLSPGPRTHTHALLRLPSSPSFLSLSLSLVFQSHNNNNMKLLDTWSVA